MYSIPPLHGGPSSPPGVPMSVLWGQHTMHGADVMLHHAANMLHCVANIATFTQSDKNHFFF